ncbi:MAG: histidine triad nucleotide-binding protein [Dehalococcoidia bacterium]
MAECIFCRIAAGEIPAEVVHRDEDIIAIRDIDPQAPKHILIIPRSHIPSLAQVSQEQRELMGRAVLLAVELARGEGMAQSGYRLVINSGPDGGQVVPHLHLHLLGGKALSPQMG